MKVLSGAVDVVSGTVKAVPGAFCFSGDFSPQRRYCLTPAGSRLDKRFFVVSLLLPSPIVTFLFNLYNRTPIVVH